MASRVTINGVTFTGNSVSVVGDKVYIDGKLVDAGKVVGNKTLDIRILEGVLQELRADGNVEAQEVRGGVHAGGSVNCKNVGGNVDAGGSVTCNVVGKNVDAGGSVTCGDVAGKVSAGGSVRRG